MDDSTEALAPGKAYCRQQLKRNNATKPTETDGAEKPPKKKKTAQMKEVDKRRHVCPTCGRGFAHRSWLTVHEATHNNNKPKPKLKCRGCEATFSSKHSRALHEQRTHDHIRPFPCTQCTKAFKRLAGLTNHMRIHTGERPHECDICHKRFIERGGLNAHRRVHFDDTPYPCDMCDRKFKLYCSLRAHKNVHRRGGDHRCPFCQIGFLAAPALKSHISKIHPPGQERKIGAKSLCQSRLSGDRSKQPSTAENTDDDGTPPEEMITASNNKSSGLEDANKKSPTATAKPVRKSRNYASMEETIKQKPDTYEQHLLDNSETRDDEQEIAPPDVQEKQIQTVTVEQAAATTAPAEDDKLPDVETSSTPTSRPRKQVLPLIITLNHKKGAATAKGKRQAKKQRVYTEAAKKLTTPTKGRRRCKAAATKESAAKVDRQTKKQRMYTEAATIKKLATQRRRKVAAKQKAAAEVKSTDSDATTEEAPYEWWANQVDEAAEDLFSPRSGMEEEEEQEEEEVIEETVVYMDASEIRCVGEETIIDDTTPTSQYDIGNVTIAHDDPPDSST